MAREGDAGLADVPALPGTHTWAKNLPGLDRSRPVLTGLDPDLCGHSGPTSQRRCTGTASTGAAAHCGRSADYLADPALRREIHEGLQVVEQWNSANVAIRYGREAELPGADREAQEISMLALHLLQSALVLVNTRLVDRVLDTAEWACRLTEHDLRGLIPLFWSNVAPHGTFELDLDNRIDYDRGAPGAAAEEVVSG